jgi:hypothetical protein
VEAPHVKKGRRRRQQQQQQQRRKEPFAFTMKFTSVVLALATASSASAYSIPNSRSSLRQLGQKSVVSKPVTYNAGSTMKMEGA